MAFVQTLPQDQQNLLAPTGQTTPNPMAMLPPQATQTGGSSGQGGGTAAPPNQGTSTQFGSNASRLGDYLQANKDQVQAMANQIAGQMGTQYGTLQQGITQTGQTFGNQVSGGYTPADPTLLSQVQENPTQAAAKPENVSAFQKMLNDQYTGPTSFEASTPYANVQQQVQNAVQQANLLGTYPGLASYLQGNIESNATPGQNTLDATLLGAYQPAWQTVQQAAAPYAGLNNYLASVAATQNQGIQTAQQAAPAVQQAAQAALGGAEGTFKTDLANKLQAATQGYQKYNQTASDLLGELGTTATQVPQVFWSANNVDPRLSSALEDIGTYNTWNPNEALNVPLASKWLGNVATAAPPTNNDIATNQDVATAKALNLLSGGAYQMPVTSAGNYTLPALPSLDQSAMASQLYALVKNANPTFLQTQNPNQSLAGYQSALSNLAAYLGIPGLEQGLPQQPPVPPPTPPTGGPITNPGYPTDGGPGFV